MKTTKNTRAARSLALFALLASSSVCAIESVKVVEPGIPPGGRITSVKVPEGVYAQALGNLDKLELLMSRQRGVEKPSLPNGINIGGFIVRGPSR